jgi:hypothetical protein
MLQNKNIKILIIILGLITILSIFIYNLNDDSFTNLHNYIFRTIYSDVVGYHFDFITNDFYTCTVDKFRDDLICIQSLQDTLGTPNDGYEIKEYRLFKEMFFKGHGKLCIFSPDQINKVNGLIINNVILHTVDPVVVDEFLELFNI